ncbi:MAG: nucleoside triphosphate pyrophosphohydrolase [Oscillospiraceae bacterium]|nr:nucleoside triphosphate pyrophosphohydrolase [Oscillospiraceae bacterium]
MGNFTNKSRYTVQDLLEIVALLRDKDNGCPWDKEQTHQSIKNNFIEETYEVVDAIDTHDDKALCEELGDVLLQVAFHAQMAGEENRFCFDDVSDGICKKLIYRHPHIFGQITANTTEEVLTNWEALKEKEKHIESAAQNLNAVPRALPALIRSRKVQKRAAAYGFTYPDVQGALADLESEITELKEAITENTNVAEELGDVLFSVANVSRFVKVEAEEALAASTDKFTARVATAEILAEENGQALKQLNAQQLDDLWKQAKKVSTKK